MGKNFVGPDELKKMAPFVQVAVSKKVPSVPFPENFLKKHSNDFILILGAEKDVSGRKLTINNLREIFGVDPVKSEPCFYNQDWYLKEKFAAAKTLESKWYLVGKYVVAASRGLEPKQSLGRLPKKSAFPAAILTAYAFFAYYFAIGGEILWKSDFIWCEDTDHNRDRIYVGRYTDPNGINKNGFNVHRHLSIRPFYGCVEVFDK